MNNKVQLIGDELERGEACRVPMLRRYSLLVSGERRGE